MTKILVLDDDVDIRETLAEVLVEHGYSVDTAADGAQGSAALRTEAYDVLLLDMMLDGGRTGLDVLRDLALVDRKRVPGTIILTAFQPELVHGLLQLEPELAKCMFPHGDPIVVFKPFRTVEVIDAITSVVAR